MFVRFRQSGHRLQVSLMETRRVAGRVRTEHIAGLGSIETPPSVRDRMELWHQLHERLGRLANRVDPSKVLGQVHARIPMVTMDEMTALKLENAEADERFWSDHRDMTQAQVEDHKALASTVEVAIAEGQRAATDAGAKASAAKERADRLKRGEDIPGGFGKPMTREDYDRILRDAGMTTSDIRHCVTVHALHEIAQKIGGEAAWKEAKREMRDAAERARRAAARKLLDEWQVLAEDIGDDAGAEGEPAP